MFYLIVRIALLRIRTLTKFAGGKSVRKIGKVGRQEARQEGATFDGLKTINLVLVGPFHAYIYKDINL